MQDRASGSGGAEEDTGESSVEVLESDHVEVFPNPTTGEVTIILLEVPEQVWLYSLSGLAGKKQRTGKLFQQKQVVNLKGLAAGMYYLRIYSGDSEQLYSEKLVIMGK